jgi:hypothetical protein
MAERMEAAPPTNNTSGWWLHVILIAVVSF